MSSLPLPTSFTARWQAVLGEAGPIVIAVSGGPDSVALARLMLSMRSSRDVTLAHFDHAWRSDSTADCAFVAELANQLGTRFEAGRAGEDERGSRAEASARRLRLDFLRRIAERMGARYVLLGHTADDQVETIVHRILRGTGLRGLRGIRSFRVLSPAVTIVRPLLPHSRTELLDYLAGLGQEYRTDVSNQDVRYTRNRIRTRLLPMLAKEYNPRVRDAILRLGHVADGVQREMELLAAERLQHPEVCITADELRFPLAILRNCGEMLACEMFMQAWQRAGWSELAMGHREWCTLAAIASEERAATKVLPAGTIARRDGGCIAIQRATSPPGLSTT